MPNRKILMLTVFIAFLAISAVSASDNATDDIVSLDNVTCDVVVSQDNLSEGSFDDLSQLIQDTTEDTLKLYKNYKNTENSSYVTIDRPITIDGQGHTIDANCASRIFYINSSDVILKNINFINGKSDYYGGALYFEPDLNSNIINSTFVNCSSPFGGAITLLGSDSHITQCRFETNYADYYGGAVFAMYGSIDFDSNNFTDNGASLGGGLYLSQVETCLVYNQFINNSASNGGAVWAMTIDLKSDVGNAYRNNRGSPQPNFYSTVNNNLTITIDDYYQFVGSYDNYTVLPSRYSMLDDNLLTPVKNQGTEGNCWSFSALAALESCILKASNITFDFSESNLKNLMANYSDYGFKIAVNGGGHAEMAYGYFASWLGPILEVNDIYHTDNILSALLNSIVHVQNIVFLKREDYLDNDDIKNAILKYGAVSTDMYYYKYYLKDSVSYYYNGDAESNHAVCIVGWDDDYSRYNFKNIPEGDGAWIVRNSWGPSWGDGGYFYVSYYDSQFAKINTNDSYTFILNDSVKLNRVYQYEIEKTSWIPCDDEIVYKNIFTAQGDEYLAAVSTYFNDECDYKVSILLNGELIGTKSGKTDMGYYTINLDNLVHLNRYDNVTVIFNCTNIKSGEGRIPCSDSNLNTNLFIPKGVSYYWNGYRWIDFSTTDAVACIKMFTTFSIENKLNPYFEIVSEGNPWDNSYAINVILPNDATGNVSFDVGGTIYVINISESRSITLYDLAQNNSTLIVTYSGDDLYLEKTVLHIVDTNLSKVGTFEELSDLINDFAGVELNLLKDYYASGPSEGIDISRSITINGNGRTINANHISEIFNVNAKNVVLKNINFAASNGSAVEIWGSGCSIINCTFTDNHVYTDDGEGAAVSWNGENGLVSDSVFVSNSAYFGGAIVWNAKGGMLTDSTFVSNYAGNGGAVYWFSDGAIVDNCTFINDSAYYGGAFYSYKNNVLISNSIFNNTCDNCEAIYIRANNSAIVNSTFINNLNPNPSIIALEGYNNTVSNSIFNNNPGRVIKISGNLAYVINSTFINNTRNIEGIAIFGVGSEIIVSDCLFINNSGKYGGAVSLCGANSKIYNSTFINNYASEWGGAVNFEDEGGYMENCTFVGNSAPYGGAVFWDNKNGIVINSLFEDNWASKWGGAVYWRNSTGNLINSTFINNLGNDQIYWIGDDGNIFECKFINTTKNNVKNYGANFIKRDLNLTTNAPANNEVIFNALANVPITSPITFRIFNAQTGETFQIYVKDNVASIRKELVDFAPGVWNVTAEFDGDDNYYSTGISFTTEVGKPYSSLNLTVVNIVSGQESTLTARVLDPNGKPINEGTVTFFDARTNIGEVNVINGVARLDYAPTTGGNHLITAFFNSENYLSSNDTAELLVDCLNMDIFVSDGKVGLKSTFVVNARGMYSVIDEGSVAFYIDGNMIGSVAVVNGSASLDYVPSVAGNRTVRAVLSGTPLSGERGTLFIVNKAESTISVVVEDNITYGENATVILTTNIDANAIIRIGTFNTTVTVTNRKAIVIIPNLDASDELYEVNVELIGGQNYENSNGSAVLKVSKAMPVFNIYVDDIEFNQVADIDVRFRKDITGYANITVSGANGYGLKWADVVLKNGIFSQELAGLNVSTYTITFEYGGNSNYNSTTAYETFNVIKANPTVNVEVTNATFGRTATITVYIDAEGNVTIDVVSVRAYENLLIENGQVILNVVDIGIGTYDVRVTYDGNDNYNNVTCNAKLAISKASSTVVANVSDITYMENATVNVLASLDGNVVVRIDNDHVESANVTSNTVKSIDFADIPVGRHNVSVIFTPNDGNFDVSSYNTSFTVFKKSTSVKLDVEDSVYGSEVIVNVTASEDGRITVAAGGVSRETDVSANTLTQISLGILAADSYEVTASFSAGNNYEMSTDKGNITVSPAEAKIIDVQTSDNIYGEDSVIKVRTDVCGTLIIQTSKGEKRVDVDADILASVDLGILDAGFQNIEIALDAGGNYTMPTANANLTVSPKATGTSVIVKDSIYGENVIVNVSATENGIIAVQIGDIVKYVDVEANKTVQVNMGIFDADSYIVNATFGGGRNFMNSYDNASITIGPKQSAITIIVAEYDASKSVIVNVKTNADGTITLKCGGISKAGDVRANVIASFDLGILPVGSYEVNASLATGNNYIDSTNSAEFKVLSKIDDRDISISIPEIKAGQENTIPITLPGDATGTVTLAIAGKSYSFDVYNGTANIKVPKLAEGSYDYIISYSGDGKYSSFTKYYSMSVTKVLSTAIVASDISTVYNGGKYLVATLTDERGNVLSGFSVSIDFNGIKYLTTDANGQVRLTTNGLAPKTYSATIAFAGNGNYFASTKTVKVTVNKATPKLAAAKKTFKVKVKTKKYTVTLKDNQNKVMKSVKVTIKVKGKTYTAKTNNKGKATFKIKNLKKKGKYSATVTFKGNSYYIKVTKKVKITVK